MTKMLTDSPQASREKTGRRNGKIMWLFLKMPFKYPVGAVLSISGGEAAILKIFWDWPGFGVAGGKLHPNKYLWSEQCKRKETPTTKMNLLRKIWNSWRTWFFSGSRVKSWQDAGQNAQAWGCMPSLPRSSQHPRKFISRFQRASLGVLLPCVSPVLSLGGLPTRVLPKFLGSVS